MIHPVNTSFSSFPNPTLPTTPTFPTLGSQVIIDAPGPPQIFNLFLLRRKSSLNILHRGCKARLNSKSFLSLLSSRSPSLFPNHRPMRASSLWKPTNQPNKSLEAIFSSRNCPSSELLVLFLLTSVPGHCHPPSPPHSWNDRCQEDQWLPLRPNQGSVPTFLGLTLASSGGHFLLTHRLFLALWCLLLALLLLWHSSSVSFADSFSGMLKFEAHFLFYIFALTDLILCHGCKWHSYADDFKFITLVLTFLSNTRLINSVADWTSPRPFDRDLKFKRSKKRTFCPS